MALRAILCQNGGEVFTVEASRGRPPTSCTKHGGTGVAVQSFRKGSKTGNDTLAKLGEAVKARQGVVTVTRPKAPRAVPVRIVSGSDEGDGNLRTLVCEFNGHSWKRPAKRGRVPRNCPEHDGMASEMWSQSEEDEGEEDDYPVEITLTGTYKPATSQAEQRRLLTAAFGEVRKPPQPRRRTRAQVQAAALQAPPTLDTPPKLPPMPADPDQEDAHPGEFWCEPGQHWHPRKSTRGRKPRACDDHRDDEGYQRERSTEYRENAANRGEAIADALIGRLRERGTDLASNSQRFQLQEWVKGRTWRNLQLTADNWGMRHWLTDDDNAHAVKLKRLRWVPFASS